MSTAGWMARSASRLPVSECRGDCPCLTCSIVNYLSQFNCPAPNTDSDNADALQVSSDRDQRVVASNSSGRSVPPEGNNFPRTRSLAHLHIRDGLWRDTGCAQSNLLASGRRLKHQGVEFVCGISLALGSAG